MTFFDRIVDERFLDHRRRSTSAAGMIGALLAVGLFAWRYFVDHVWSWDLFAIGAAVVVIKVLLMVWFVFTD